MYKMNCILLVDEYISNTFLVYKLLRKLNLSSTIHIERGSTNAFDFVQEYAKTNNNSCPELIIINNKIIHLDGYLFLDFMRGKNFANKDKVKVLVTGNLTENPDYKEITIVPDPVTQLSLLKAIENLGLKTFAA